MVPKLLPTHKKSSINYQPGLLMFPLSSWWPLFPHGRHFLVSQWSDLWPFSPHFLHVGSFLLAGWGGKTGALGRGTGGAMGASITCIAHCIASWPSWTVIPPSWGICLVDRLRFCFCFSHTACNLCVSTSNKAVECIWISQALRTWSICCFSGLGGLFDCCFKRALIELVYCWSLIRFWGVLGENWLDWWLPRGVGVRRIIFNLESTYSR